jgi:hypothetical protein
VNVPSSRWISGAAATVAIFLTLTLASLAQPLTDAGVEAATAWLKLIDDGNYAASWQDASSYFRSQIPEDKWVDTIGNLRKLLGGLAGRELASAQAVTTLPGAPDGNYLVVQFRSSFTSKHSAIETVIMLLAKNGHYAVAGYFVR